MLNVLKNSLISVQNSAKVFVHKLNLLNKVTQLSKRNKLKREFSDFDGNKSSYASMEISRQLELVFKYIDANGDGKISPHELSKFLLCFEHDKSKVAKEAAGMLKHLDSNGDGFLDLNEYMDVVMMGDGYVHDGHDDGYVYGGGDVYDDVQYDNHKHGSLEVDLMDAFQVFDYDKNGLISAKELHHVMKRLGFVNCSLKECNLMIQGVDKDGDGFVNFEEFRLMMMGDDKCLSIMQSQI